MSSNDEKNIIGSRISKIILLTIIVGAAAAVYSMDKIGVKPEITSESQPFSKSGFNLTFTPESKAQFYSDGTGNMFHCTVNGIKYMSQDGNSKWDIPVTMGNPVLLGEGPYACLAEQGGHALSLFDKSGRVYNFEFQGRILFFSLNKAGYVSALVKDGANLHTVVLSRGGIEISKIAHQTENIFPMASDVSTDGRMVAISFININKVELEANLVFYYINKADINREQNSDGIFKALDFKAQMIPRLKFMDNNVLIYASDSQIGGIYADEKTSDKDWALELNNKITALTFIDGVRFGFINGEGLLNQIPEPEGILNIYDTGGKLTAQYDGGDTKKNTYIYNDGSNLILGYGQEFRSVGINGKINYSYNSAQDTKQLIYLGNVNTLLQVSDTSAEILKRGKA